MESILALELSIYTALKRKTGNRTNGVTFLFFCFIPRYASGLTAFICLLENIPEEKRPSLPSLSSSFLGAAFMGRVGPSLCTIFWKYIYLLNNKFFKSLFFVKIICVTVCIHFWTNAEAVQRTNRNFFGGKAEWQIHNKRIKEWK